MMFAQIPVEPMQLVGWLGSAAALLIILNQGGKFMDRFKEKPTPNETYVRKEQHREHQQRIREIAEDVGRLRTELQDQNREMRARMDALPSQIISMLRNTGAIGDKRP